MMMVQTSTFGMLLRDKFAQLEADSIDSEAEAASDPLERLRLDALQSVLASEGGPLQRQGHHVYATPTATPVASEQQLDVRY